MRRFAFDAMSVTTIVVALKYALCSDPRPVFPGTVRLKRDIQEIWLSCAVAFARYSLRVVSSVNLPSPGYILTPC